jgi:F-type H+-transporting ATPase subunit epsilon
MEKTFLLEIVTHQGLVVSTHVEEAYIPGSQGDFGVLPGHAPFLTSLRVGEIHYRQDKKIHYVAVNRGFADVIATRATILTDTAEAAGEIDIARAQRAQTRAAEQLQSLPRQDPGYQREKDALERARIRIQVAEKGQKNGHSQDV